MKNNMAIKSCNKFTVFHILNANSSKQFQNVAKLLTVYSEEVPQILCERFLFKTVNRD